MRARDGSDGGSRGRKVATAHGGVSMPNKPSRNLKSFRQQKRRKVRTYRFIRLPWTRWAERTKRHHDQATPNNAVSRMTRRDPLRYTVHVPGLSRHAWDRCFPTPCVVQRDERVSLALLLFFALLLPARIRMSFGDRVHAREGST